MASLFSKGYGECVDKKRVIMPLTNVVTWGDRPVGMFRITNKRGLSP